MEIAIRLPANAIATTDGSVPSKSSLLVIYYLNRILLDAIRSACAITTPLVTSILANANAKTGHSASIVKKIATKVFGEAVARIDAIAGNTAVIR